MWEREKWQPNKNILFLKKQLPTQENWKQHPRKNLYVNVHSSIIHNSQKIKITQNVRQVMTGKQDVVYPHDGILFSHTGKKEFSTDTYNNVMNVETNMREARHKRLPIVWYHLCEMYRIGKSVEAAD